ncbi:MAG TPA: UDP-N-acetylmuramoyl-L-alanine--D-glutamate ligase [Candidatus Binataceae bacterium]|nr:UDP-N-acetylmuramoyl-L-alanine--D-glutamate ligase [Candidatus Binataceae bacterium]
MELQGKRIMVIGLGVSGLAASRLLAAHGANLVLVDRRAGMALEGLPSGEVRLGEDDPQWLDGVELVVVSPGVPPSSRLMRAATAARIRLISELELSSRFVTAPIVAVTGTNGKSTVVVLLGEIFRRAGYKTFVGGNLGTALADAASRDYDVVVAEVSSYQLELIETFKPRVAIYLNLTDDHLDRYASLEEYGRAKERIFENQDTDDWAILNRDDPRVWRVHKALKPQLMSFGCANAQSAPALWRKDGAIAFDDGVRRGRISLAEFKLAGAHNVANAMAAAGGAFAMGIEPLVVERALAESRGLPHRIETVSEKGGVRYVDDSKGTNVGAVIEALSASRAPVILLAGGVDKGGDYAPLITSLREKVKLLILFGAARAKMHDELAGSVAIEVVTTLDEAVALAARRAVSGDTVLLSPACSSFDQFKDYAERGRVFQELVQAL